MQSHGLWIDAAGGPEAGRLFMRHPSTRPRQEATELLQARYSFWHESAHQRREWMATERMGGTIGKELCLRRNWKIRVQGHYHGYPLPEDDEIVKQVLEAWETLRR